MKTIKRIFLMLSFFLLSANNVWALDKFMCECRAPRPGFEATNKTTGGIDKICEYNCTCNAWSATAPVVTGINLELKSLATSAASKERWDFGSHVCHGQYSYKSNLGDPNWQIQVRFDKFHINEQGRIIYADDDKRQIALNMYESGFKYSPFAPEIAQALKERLKKF
jgi:hypothetical protein